MQMYLIDTLLDVYLLLHSLLAGRKVWHQSSYSIQHNVCLATNLDFKITSARSVLECATAAIKKTSVSFYIENSGRWGIKCIMLEENDFYIGCTSNAVSVYSREIGSIISQGMLTTRAEIIQKLFIDLIRSGRLTMTNVFDSILLTHNCYKTFCLAELG